MATFADEWNENAEWIAAASFSLSFWTGISFPQSGLTAALGKFKTLDFPS